MLEAVTGFLYQCEERVAISMLDSCGVEEKFTPRRIMRTHGASTMPANCQLSQLKLIELQTMAL